MNFFKTASLVNRKIIQASLLLTISVSCFYANAAKNTLTGTATFTDSGTDSGKGSAKSDKKVKPEPVVPLKQTMDELFLQMIQLRRFMVSDQAFSDPAHKKEIQSHLDRLTELGQAAKHSSLLKARGLQISKEVLVNHLKDTSQAFEKGNPMYARWMLGATTSMCFSCHTQVPTSQNKAWTKEIESQIPDAFDQAEFYFLSRQFERAHDLYLEFMKKGPGTKFSPLQIDKSLERLVLIDARMNQDPKLLSADMEVVQKNKKLAEGLRTRAQLWQQYGKDWDAEKVDPDILSKPDEIENLAVAMMHKADGVGAEQLDLQTVIYARLSGFLDLVLNTRPEDQLTPKLLYWLAISDRHFPQSYFMSMGDLYLKDCMNRFTKSATAQLCFNAYKENQTMAYSGSSGTHMPEDVEKEIQKWQTKVEARKKPSDSAKEPVKAAAP